MTNFSDLGLSPSLLKVLPELNLETPTKIQQKAIPILINEADRDFIGLAQTGTGKTAAFGLPLLDAIDVDAKGTQALVLAPTRELGQQIAQQIQAFSKYLKGVRVQVVYGGAAITPQIKALKNTPHIIIATPGRLLDLIKRKAINLSAVKHVVFDEADEMLNMGFRDDIDDILSYTQGEKSTWLFSATMAGEIRDIVNKYMNNPSEVKIDTGTLVNQNIDHQYFVTKAKDKTNLLERIIELEPDMRGIVFCRTKRDTQELAQQLQSKGLPVDAIHGDLSQSQRDQVMKRFKNHSLEFLIATDVAARGIDVNDLTHVIHHSIPDDLEYYTHRSGRTGRAGKKGISLAIVTSSEQRKLKSLEKRLKLNFTPYQLPSAVKVQNEKLQSWAKNIALLDIDTDAVLPHKDDVEPIFASLSKSELIDKLIMTQLNSMGISTSTTNFEQDFDKNDRGGKSEKRSSSGGRYERFFINVGAIDGYDKKDLINLVIEKTGISKSAVGPVTMEDRRAYFEVEREVARSVEPAFRGMELDGREIRVNGADTGGKRNSRSSKRLHDHRSGYKRGDRNDRSGRKGKRKR
ncbi:DEAD/DEAH box helicase [Fulvivirga ulvae]|uniref:DEAD/DEAH box helicase n=1 Tax=Fulvivirga ulvae TaxID=2904245 RepID=UPI001F25D1ED|nr:DEAD/DEAH box helicase [Fulvivirga ulvae]UII31426.1 DEAD/DEAH box helicase [Fulvivirga ulvae]